MDNLQVSQLCVPSSSSVSLEKIPGKKLQQEVQDEEEQEQEEEEQEVDKEVDGVPQIHQLQPWIPSNPEIDMAMEDDYSKNLLTT